MATTTRDLEQTPAAALRAWAKGLYPLEASVELLIRTGFAQDWRPWIVVEEPVDPSGAPHAWVDYEALVQDGVEGPMSSGERRLLSVAASLAERGGEGARLFLGDAVSGLNRHWVDLILAAVAHASGSHEGRPVHIDRERGLSSFGDPYASLHPWPEAYPSSEPQ